jgi:DNA-binding response OmpR family regulator
VGKAVDTVLLVDDDQDLREILSDLFLVEGVRACVVAGSLDDVETRANDSLAANLAILDVNLGDGHPTGVDVCRWLREHGFAAPIVFLTGHAASDPRVLAASQMPGTRVLSKPISIEELSRLVKP